VELIKFHVRDLGAGAVSHRHAVARRHVRIRGVQVNLAGAARGNHGGARQKRLDATVLLVEHVRADALVGAAELAHRDQIHTHVPLEQTDVRRSLDALEQDPLDLLSGEVSCVNDASLRMSALAAEVELAGFRARKLCTELSEPVHRLRRFAHAQVDDHLVAQGGAGDARVLGVFVERVVGRQHGGHPALRPARRSVVSRTLGDEHDLAVLGSAHGEAETRNAAAEDEKVSGASHGRRRLVYRGREPSGQSLRFLRENAAWGVDAELRKS
jgi:hypothetical protein